MNNKNLFVTSPDFCGPDVDWKAWEENNKREKIAIAEAKEQERLAKRDWIDTVLEISDAIKNALKSRGSR